MSTNAKNSSANLNAEQLQRSYNEVTASAEMLRTESDRIGFLARAFGFGRRILVPADEIHVVVGDGLHSLAISHQSKVFGKTAGHSSYYWLNALSQVIKLKTVSFTVPIRGEQGEGVEALDSSKVSFRLWAHAVAKLNPEKAEIAAQRVGVDTTSLLNTITKVGTAELVAAAATMALQDIIADRQRLAEIAFPKVNQILAELGYDLALLTVTELGGAAYIKLVEQAESRIYKETTIATNREQVAELQDRQARARVEAEISAATEKKLAAERLEAEREVEEATLGQQEQIAVRRHEVELRSVERQKQAAATAHEAEVVRVQLSQELARSETEKEAALARLRAERDAALRLTQTEAEAERLALAQAREMERAAARTQAEAQRLQEEELAAAERAKKVALVGMAQEAESLSIQTEAETKAELVRAEAEASAIEKRAQAAKVRAEATRAESAALGLAEAEVESARIDVAERRVAVTRAEGLTAVEIAQAEAEADALRFQKMKEAEIGAQRQLVQLYAEAPVLVELEKMRLQMAHQEKLAQMQMEATLRAFEAIAPNIHLRIVGNGGQTGRLLADLLGLVQTGQILGEEVPGLARLVGSDTANDSLLGGLNWDRFLPVLQETAAEIEPRILAGMSVGDLINEMAGVVSGQTELSAAIEKLRGDASFRVIGNLPVGSLLRTLGLTQALNGAAADAVENAA